MKTQFEINNLPLRRCKIHKISYPWKGWSVEELCLPGFFVDVPVIDVELGIINGVGVELLKTLNGSHPTAETYGTNN